MDEVREPCHFHYSNEDIGATEQDKLDFDFVHMTINFSFIQHFLQYKILRKNNSNINNKLQCCFSSTAASGT